MAYRVGIDIGGTFTDLLLLDEETGRSVLYKTPSTPGNPAEGALEGLERLLERADADAAAVAHVIHGTTVATNAVLEGRGARVGLLCTRGFEQVLHLARSETPPPIGGWINFQKPDPLAAVEDTRSVVERMSARGEVLEPLDEDQARGAIAELLATGIDSLAIALINSWANPTHEQRLRELVLEQRPDLSVSISTDVLPEFREYERTNVAVTNAYVRPRLKTYLEGLKGKLVEAGATGSLSILRSDGGLMTVDSATEYPVQTLFSGPAGGVAGAGRIARMAGFPNFLTFDMGGTSTDVALCLDGEPVFTRETHLGHFPIKVPAIDVRSVGAGGGSIAHVPEVTNALRVGPQSAGAVPGPAAYGRGGTEATVTDANLVLGYLPRELLGGEMEIDIERAREAVGKVADRLGLSIEEAAEGIIDVVNENMTGALRVVSVQRGHDPREFALVAFGGAGPLHANALARLLGSFPVILPPSPGVLSALGAVVSPFRSEFTETFIQRFDRTDTKTVLEGLERLATSGRDWLSAQGIDAADQEITFSVDVRYRNQALEIPVDVKPEEIAAHGFDAIAEKFAEVHEREYGFRLDVVCEFVNLRAAAVGAFEVDDSAAVEATDRPVEEAEIARQEIYYRGHWLEGRVYDRDRLSCGHRIEGPAIIVQLDSTSLVLPGSVAEVDSHLNVLIRDVEEQADPEQAESPIVIDIIENGLRNISREMDTVTLRAAMSTVIREEHDTYPLLTDEHGRMIAGVSGWSLVEFFETYPKEKLGPGDLLMLNDPYLCDGAVQHTPDMLLLRPIFFEGELVGFSSQFGNLMDIGGPVPGSIPAQSRSIFEEGIRFPPVKLYDGGEIVEDVLNILARNSRTPEITVADTLAMVAATRAAELRVVELCRRFGVDTYRSTCQKLLDRTHRAAKLMIEQHIPEEPLVFEDVVDDDGRGNGPFKIRMSLWREGSRAICDFEGSSPQAEGPINLYMGATMMKQNLGHILLGTLDPQILFNHGYIDLFTVKFPPSSIVRPDFPAPLSNRAHTLARVFDVLQGTLAQQNPRIATGAACGSSPHMLYSGYDDEGEFFFFFEINYGGIPGRPLGDGPDVHAWWPGVKTLPVEYVESYFPMRIDRIHGHVDSGGPGINRGGNGVEKVYTFLAAGQVSIHDDRHISRAWGIAGGMAAANSRKLLIRNGTEQELPSKFDFLEVEPGDKIVYITGGGGGWGEPHEREIEAVRRDVLRGFVSPEAARESYGVIVDPNTFEVDEAASAKLRTELAAARSQNGAVFDFGKQRPREEATLVL
jgi:5-oxoprolinase (ATP-hydrolysing)